MGGMVLGVGRVANVADWEPSRENVGNSFGGSR